MATTSEPGCAATSLPNTVTNGPPHQQHLFFVGIDGLLYHSWWDGVAQYIGENWVTQVPDSTPPPPSPTSDPIALPLPVPAGKTQLHAHYRGPDGTLWRTSYDLVTWSSGSIGSVSTPAPAVNIYGSGRLLAGANFSADVTGRSPVEQHVFYPGTDGILHQTWWDGSNWKNAPAGPGPSQVAAGAIPAVVESSVAGTLPVRQHVFYLGPDGLFHHDWWDGSNWNTQVIGGTGAGPPSAGGRGDTGLDGLTTPCSAFYFRGGPDSNELTHIFWTGSRWELQQPQLNPNQNLLSEP